MPPIVLQRLWNCFSKFKEIFRHVQGGGRFTTITHARGRFFFRPPKSIFRTLLPKETASEYNFFICMELVWILDVIPLSSFVEISRQRTSTLGVQEGIQYSTGESRFCLDFANRPAKKWRSYERLHVFASLSTTDTLEGFRWDEQGKMTGIFLNSRKILLRGVRMWKRSIQWHLSKHGQHQWGRPCMANNPPHDSNFGFQQN